METIHIAGISGSLRRGSFNTALLRAAGALLPGDTKLEIVEYDDVPLFNHDIERMHGFPEPVQEIREGAVVAHDEAVRAGHRGAGLPGRAQHPPGGVDAGAEAGADGPARQQRTDGADPGHDPPVLAGIAEGAA